VLLLHFLQWFRRHSRTPFRVLLKTDGPLRTDFEQLAPVHVWNGSYPHRDSIRLIYSSTATNGFLLNALARPGMPVITHAHELEYVLTHHTDRANADGILRHTTHFIAGSTAVAHYLQTAHAVAPAHISVVRDFIDRPPTFRIRARAQAQLRRELGIPADAPVVAAAGTPEWRKAPELFVVLARMVQRRRGDAPVHFIWIGGEPTGPIHGALRHDIQRAGLERLVHLVPATPRYAEYLALSDVFALLSREDCFPVVNLAAAALEKPIVCFDRSGGTPEFVERDCGYVVPYLDLETMAERILELIHQPNLRAAMGACAAQKMRRGHTVTVAGPRIKQIIDRFWRNSP
jgi:glycosyltransferase involved in cell wall biosynthesis